MTPAVKRSAKSLKTCSGHFSPRANSFSNTDMRIPIFMALAALISARAEVVYEKDIAPILRTYCAGCHNNEEHENEFSVETFARLRKGGEDKGDPIKPGAAD